MRRFLPALILSALSLTALSLTAARADAAQVAAAGKVSLNLNAVIAQGAKKTVKDPVTWTVVEMFNDKKPGAPAASATEASPTFSLPAGHYLVTAKLGEAQGQETVELTSAPVKVNINLNAGVLRVNLIPYAGAKAVTDPVHWELFNYARGAGALARVAEANAAAWEFILPAGGYVLRAAYQGTLSELVVPLDAGQTFNYTLNLYAGKAKAAAVTEKGGGFKDPVTWEVVRAADRNQLVTTAVAPSGQFTLREGRYIVLARQGNYAGEAPLEIKAGKSSAVKVTLKTLAADQVAALDKASKDRKQMADAALAPKPGAAAAPAKTQVAAATPASAPAVAAAAAATPAPAQPAAPAAASPAPAAAAAASTAPAAPPKSAEAPASTATAAPAAAGSKDFQPSTTRSLAETMKLAQEAQEKKKRAESATAAAAPQPAATEVAAADATSGAATTATPAAAEATAATPTPAAAAASTTTAAAADTAPKPKGSVSVSAWSKASEKFRDPVEWQIRRVQDNGAVVPDLVEAKTAAAPKFALPAGSYVIWGRQGTLIGKQKFDVQSDQTVAIRVFMQTPKLTEKSASTTTSAEPAAAPTSGGG